MSAAIKILVVDDDPYLLDLLLETLKTIGYGAYGAPDAMQALARLDEYEFQLVITDINMPGMDGLEFARRVKAQHPRLPVIFITGVFNPDDVRKITDGPLLTKPFRIGQMEEMIQSALADTPSVQTKPPETILVVDDDDSFRIMLMETLRLSGYDVIGAASGQEALSVLDLQRVRAVITDVKMPGMDGLTLAGYVKKLDPALPVILVTAYLPAEEKLGDLSGIDGYLMKPFKIESITELLESLKITGNEAIK